MKKRPTSAKLYATSLSRQANIISSLLQNRKTMFTSNTGASLTFFMFINLL